MKIHNLNMHFKMFCGYKPLKYLFIYVIIIVKIINRWDVSVYLFYNEVKNKLHEIMPINFIKL